MYLKQTTKKIIR